MKCIKKCLQDKDGTAIITYDRVADDSAENLVFTSNWTYCPKSEWKENCRDKFKSTKTKTKEVK